MHEISTLTTKRAPWELHWWCWMLDASSPGLPGCNRSVPSGCPEKRSRTWPNESVVITFIYRVCRWQRLRKPSIAKKYRCKNTVKPWNIPETSLDGITYPSSTVDAESMWADLTFMLVKYVYCACSKKPSLVTKQLCGCKASTLSALQKVHAAAAPQIPLSPPNITAVLKKSHEHCTQFHISLKELLWRCQTYFKTLPSNQNQDSLRAHRIKWIGNLFASVNAGRQVLHPLPYAQTTSQNGKRSA